MTPSHRAADHATHDPLVVAAAADRGGRLPPALADCPDCRALHAELVALAAAVPDAALPRRPRDYALTPADAARLRPAGWRGWFARIGTARDHVTRPLALGLTTLGLAGLLFAAAPSLLPMGGATSGPAVEEGSGQAPAGITLQGAASSAKAGAPVVAAPVVPSGGAGIAPAEPAVGAPEPEIGSPAAASDMRDRASADVQAPGTSDPVLVVAAGAALVAGLGLFVVRRAGGRRASTS
jgi:hypothetical protein